MFLTMPGRATEISAAAEVVPCASDVVLTRPTKHTISVAVVGTR
jgi:hypothetical protein